MVALAAATALVLAPAAQAGTPAVDTVVTDYSTADRAAALEYWTPERMRQVGVESSERAEVIAQPWRGTPPQGTGRLFFVENPGQDAWCTATAVHSGNKDVVVTAGHCVWPGFTREGVQIKSEKMVFVPGYDNGARPEGVFAARATLIARSYTEQSSPDVAMVVFDQSGGRHLADAAGAQDIAFDRTTAGRSALLGYPGSKGAHGESLRWCDIEVTQDSNPDRWHTPCDMAGGSSGGPWLADFDQATGHGTIYSVTSKGALDLDPTTNEVVTTELVGPKLDGVARSLYEQAGQR
ncbi:peptidase [Kutzneria viridogrisea]